jgi:hypothetical protein
LGAPRPHDEHDRLIDTVFGDVLRGCLAYDVVREGDLYQIWDGTTWMLGCKAKHFSDRVRTLLGLIFGRFGTDVFGRDVITAPPPPLRQDDFIEKTAGTMVKYLPSSDHAPIDSACAYKLLGSDGSLYDWSTGTMGRASANDRLWRCTEKPLREYETDAVQLDRIDTFTKQLAAFFRSGGVDLSMPTDGDERLLLEQPALKELRTHLNIGMADIIAHDPESMVAGLWNVFEDLNMVVYILRWDSRILSGNPRFAEMANFIGPAGAAKSWVVLRLTAFLGQGSRRLCQPMPSNFLHEATRTDAESSKPVTRDARGAKMLVFKEMPEKPFNATAVKSMLDSRDCHVSARANSSTAGDETNTFGVAWAMVGQANSESLMPCGNHGLTGKIHDIICQWVFKNADEYDENNPRHRRASATLADRTVRGELSDEVFFWARKMYETLASDICTGRNICPIPPALRPTDEVMAEEEDGKDYHAFIMMLFEPSSPADATGCSAVKKILTERFGTMTAVDMARVGLGPSTRGQFKPRNGPGHDFYKYRFGNTLSPLRAKLA